MLCNFRLSIPHDKLITLTDRDKCKARELLERPYIKSQDTWLQEVFKDFVRSWSAKRKQRLNQHFRHRTCLTVQFNIRVNTEFQVRIAGADPAGFF